MKTKTFFKCLYDAGYYTVHHDGIEHAGYLAFLGMLSFFPFLVFLIAIAGVIGELQIGIEFVNNTVSLLPEDFIAALKPRINEIVSGPPQGLLTIAILGAIWTASSAVEGLRTILNRAYHVQTPPAYIWRRLLSILQFFGLTAAAILATLSLILAPVILENFERLSEVQQILDPFWTYIRYGLSGLLVFLSVATSYYILPNIRQSWRAVAPGALIVLVLWMAAAALFSEYLQNFEQVNLIYGSLGGIIAALLFFYIIGIIYIFGAEFNYFFERAMGNKIVQKEKVSKKDLK